jgi:O-antigen ligase
MQAVGSPQPSLRGNVLPLAGLVLLSTLLAIGSYNVGAMAVLPIFGVIFVALVLARPEYGIALFLSTFLMAYPSWLQGVGYLTLNNLLGAMFLVLLVYKVYREQDWWFLWCPEIHLLGFIILTYWLSSRFNEPDPQKVSLLGAGFYFAEGLRTFVNRAAFTLFFIVYIRTPAHVRMIYLLAVAFMVFTSLTGVQGVLHGGGLKSTGRAYSETTELVAGQAGLIRAAGNPNRLAMFSILAIAALWFLMQYLRIPMLNLVFLPTMVLLAFAVFLTASRSGLLGLVVCIGAILLEGGIDIRKILSFVLAGMLLVSIVGQFVPEKSLERITNLPGTESAATGEGSASLERRQGAIQVAWDMFKDSPILGVGMGNWAVARFLKDPGYVAGSPHNSYLLALVEGGIFCLLGFLALLFRTWQNLRFAERHVTQPNSPFADLKWVVKSAKVSLVVLVFFSLVADLWNLVILFMLVGFGVVIRRLIAQNLQDDASGAYAY